MQFQIIGSLSRVLILLDQIRQSNPACCKYSMSFHTSSTKHPHFTEFVSDEVPEDLGAAVSKPEQTVTVKAKSFQEPVKHRSTSPSGSRSPLSPVNYTRIPTRNGSDTPRGMVQRKQVLRVEKLRGSPLKSTARTGQYQVFCDKENTAWMLPRCSSCSLAMFHGLNGSAEMSDDFILTLRAVRVFDSVDETDTTAFICSAPALQLC